MLFTEGLPDLFERDGALYSAEFLIRNSGQTPAHAARVWAKLEALPRDLPKSYTFEKPTSEDGFGNRFVVSPGSRHTHSVSYETKSPQMHFALARGDQALYQWGEIRYNDGFAKEQRRTRFRLRLLLWDKPDGKRVGLWSYCDEGNDAT